MNDEKQHPTENTPEGTDSKNLKAYTAPDWDVQMVFERVAVATTTG